jgi:hypothetical protein
MSELERLYGTDEPLPEERVLRAGPLEAIFSLGALRGIRLCGVEVVRGIYFLIRDRNWATLVPEIRDLAIDERTDGFRVSFTAHGTTPSDDVPVTWRGEISASATDGLVFTAVAEPGADLVTGRTGFIVLHALERTAGAAVTIEHSDGRLEQSRFPDRVDPLCAFTDVRAMTHEPIAGIRATVRMEADQPFETEDHRNWLDASFKTYFRPLALPWPYTVKAGERIEQAIRLSFEPSIADLAATPVATEVVVACGDRTGLSMPRIGLAVTPEELDASLKVAATVAELGAQSLAIRVQTDTRDLPGVLRKAALLADALDAAPVLEIVVAARDTPARELDLVAVAADSAGLDPAAVVVSPVIDLKSYPPSIDRPLGPALDELYAAAEQAFPAAMLGGGMFSYFTELNRRRVPTERLDFVQHATAAIVHAADDRSVMETLEALPHVFRSVRAFAPGVGYRVGPANIAMGFNPYGASTTPNPQNLKRTMVTDDPRQRALFGAAWATGYLARAAAAGVDVVTMMAPAGPFGVVEPDGTKRPAFHVLQAFARVAGGAVRAIASSDPQRVLASACDVDGRTFLWLVNLTPNAQPLTLAGAAVARTRLLTADGLGAGDARVLPPFATAFVEA